MVDRSFRETALPELKIKKASICVDEVFSNIVKYSGAASVSAVERIQGGMVDIFITKNYTDDASYARIDDKNLLTLTMKLS